MELPDDDKKMSKHVGVWIMYRDTVVIYTLVILTVHLLVTIKIIINARCMYLKNCSLCSS